MTAVAFPRPEALIAAITAGLLSREELATPVRYWREGGTIWVRPVEALAEQTTVRLVDRGAKSAKKRPPRRAREGSCWLEAVELTEANAAEAPEATVLFALGGGESMLSVAGEMIRLGCDRQRFLGGEMPLLMVEAPPYYTVLRALDPRSEMRGFVPVVGSRVWVELGYGHPLAERIVTRDTELLLISRDGWRVVPDGPWEEIDSLIEVALPGGEVAFQPGELEGPLLVTLRLTPTGRVGSPSLWVLRDDPFAQLERVLADLPAAVVDGLLFAVGEVDGEEVVVLRAREGASPVELGLRAERYAPHVQLPSLWLPCDKALEPPLGRSHLRRVLTSGPGSCSWLRPGEDGAFTVERAQDAAFKPLGEWVDYVVSRSQDVIQAWVRSTVFDLDEVTRVAAELEQRPPSSDAPVAEKSVTERSPVEASKPPKKPSRRRAKKRSEEQAVATEEVVATEPSAAMRRLEELEVQFFRLDAPADAPERLTLWRELADAYVEAGQTREAAHGFARVLWERPADRSTAEAWAAAEGVHGTLAAIVKEEWPSPEQMHWLVAQLAGAAPEAPGGDVALEELAQFVDAHRDGLDVRGRWLAQLALSRMAGGDTLRLTRARDRALAELRSGLSLDRDVPAFVRARATGHGDRELSRLLRAELEQLWASYGSTKRRRSAIEAPEEVSASYARRLFAYGFARLGDKDRVRELLAVTDAADGSDPVHATLLGLFDARVQQALVGLAPTTPLPVELTARLNALPTFDRYKVDRLREASEVLEPVERLEPAPGYIRGEADPRGDAFASLRGLAAGPELSTHIREIVRRACSDATPLEERARLLDGAMDFFFVLPVSQATSLLEELVPALEPIEPYARALLVEEALVLAAHFGHEPLIELLSKRLRHLLGELEGERIEEIGAVLAGAMRTLRRVGLRDRAAELLESLASLTTGDGAEVAGVHAAGGFLFLGETERAEPLLERGRAVAHADGEPIKHRLALVRALAHAAALLPVPARVSEVRGLGGCLPSVTDSFSTNSHFCLSLLHFLESLITGLVPPDRGRDGPAGAYIDEDEHLVRRRIHRDLREALR